MPEDWLLRLWCCNAADYQHLQLHLVKQQHSLRVSQGLHIYYVQIAVLKETAGKGTFCSLVMAVVVVKDILVFCCFAVNLELSTVVSVSRAGMLPASLCSTASWAV